MAMVSTIRPVAILCMRAGITFYHPLLLQILRLYVNSLTGALWPPSRKLYRLILADFLPVLWVGQLIQALRQQDFPPSGSLLFPMPGQPIVLDLFQRQIVRSP